MAPPPLPRRLRERRFEARFAGDQQRLNLRAAITNRADAIVSVVARDWAVVHEAPSAMHLDGEIGALGSDLAGVKLGHRELLKIGPALINIPRSAIRQEPRSVDLQRHLCNHLLNKLKPADRSAESLSFFRKDEGVIEAGLREAERTGGQKYPRLLIAAVEHEPPPIHGADDLIGADVAILKIKRTRVGGAPAHLR